MIGRSIVLLILIGILAFGGIMWFDFLNVIDAKTILAPIYEHIPFVQGIGRLQPVVEPDTVLVLENERWEIRIEALELQRMEMETRQRDIDAKQWEIDQKAQELGELQRSLEEIQNTIIAQNADAENKDRNVEQNARYLTGMPPQNAVGIIALLDDQDAIDVIRKTEEIAQAEGTASIVPFWFSLMEPAKAAELQRKMAGRPPSL